jgi:hypothetical protein
MRLRRAPSQPPALRLADYEMLSSTTNFTAAIRRSLSRRSLSLLYDLWFVETEIASCTTFCLDLMALRCLRLAGADGTPQVHKGGYTGFAACARGAGT